MHAPLTLTAASDSLAIRPWPDPVIDTVGLDPRSSYVETYWLGILGPSTTWLMRRLVAGLELSPAGYDLALGETAACLGLGHKGGRHSPFVRALGRLVQFDMAQPQGEGTLAVRRKMPPLNRRQVAHLPEALQESHTAWQEAQLRLPYLEHQRRRSRQLALTMFELGEDLEATERQLQRWKFHPALAYESSRWAWKRHQDALAAAQASESPTPDTAALTSEGAA